MIYIYKNHQFAFMKIIITFSNIETEKFHIHRNPILIDDVGTDKKLIS